MKKTYISPNSSIYDINHREIIATSPNVYNNQPSNDDLNNNFVKEENDALNSIWDIE